MKPARFALAGFPFLIQTTLVADADAHSCSSSN